MRVAPIILFLISAPHFLFFSKHPGRLKGRIRYSKTFFRIILIKSTKKLLIFILNHKNLRNVNAIPDHIKQSTCTSIAHFKRDFLKWTFHN